MKALPLSLLVILLAACSGSPPRIQSTDWMPVYTKDLSRGGVYEELDFFVRLEDEDGLEDISELSIHRDDRGWAWKLNEENWISRSKDGENWIGANGLCRDGGIPEGEYRLKVTDRSGQSSETLFEYSSPGVDAEKIRFPFAVSDKDRIRIDGAGRAPLLLWFYNDRGDFVGERYLAPGFFSRDELQSAKKEEAAHWFMIYFRDEEGGYGLKTGPFLLNEIPVDETEAKPEASSETVPNPQASVSASATSEDS